MPENNSVPANRSVPKILIVGGGYAGFYTAWKLEKHLRKGEAEVTMVDPLPYMTYQPFLPEVAAGSIEARHRGGRTSPPPQAHQRDHGQGHPHRPRQQGRHDHPGLSASRTSSRMTTSPSPPVLCRVYVPDPRHRRQRDRSQDDRRGRRCPRQAHVEL